MPRGGIIVNTARGGVVVEEDIAELTASGRIMAGLDVCAEESQWQNNPMATVPSAIYTGHGRWKPERPADVAAPTWVVPDFALKNIAAFVAGEPIDFTIDLETYDRTT